MFTRRARAYSSSCSQVILVYFHLFRRNSLFAAENRKNNYLKTSIQRFKVIQGHRCWYHKKARH